MPSGRRSGAVDVIAYLANSEARLAVLQALGTTPRRFRTLAATTGISPERLRRVLDEFEDRDWIVETDGTYRLTPFGTRVDEGFATTLEMLAVERRLRPVLPWFPTEEVTFDIECLRDAEVVRSTESEPEGPVHRTVALLGAGDRLRIVADHVPSALLDGIWRAVVRGDASLDAVITTGLVDTIGADSELVAKFRVVLEATETTVSVTEGAPPCVIVVDDTVGIVLTDGEHTFRALIISADDRVREWAYGTCRAYRDDADRLTPDSFT